MRVTELKGRNGFGCTGLVLGQSQTGTPKAMYTEKSPTLKPLANSTFQDILINQRKPIGSPSETPAN